MSKQNKRDLRRLNALEASQKTFADIYKIMFSEPDGVTCEGNDGFRTYRYTFGQMDARCRKAAAALFGVELPIGKVLEIKGEPFTVVGIAELTTKFEPAISSYNDYYMYADTSAGAVFIPSSTWPMVFYFDEPQNVAVKATSTDTMTRAGKAVADALNEKRLRGAALDVFTSEPLRESPLYTLKDPYRLLASPHNAWSPVEAIDRLIGCIEQNIADYVARR